MTVTNNTCHTCSGYNCTHKVLSTDLSRIHLLQIMLLVISVLDKSATKKFYFHTYSGFNCHKKSAISTPVQDITVRKIIFSELYRTYLSNK